MDSIISTTEASCIQPAVTPVQLQTEPVPTRRGFLGGLAVAAVAAPAIAALTATRSEAQSNFSRDARHVARDFRDIQRHENAHVQALLGILGTNARPKPTFHNLLQRHYSAFVNTSQALENTGVGAYLGAAPAIKNPAYLAAAGSVAFIEARHAGFLNNYNGARITTNVMGLEQSFETSLSPQQVVTLAGPFIVSLNGGPPVSYDPNPANRSDANDIAILNFALPLEYLEQEFYNLNVPRFFRN